MLVAALVAGGLAVSAKQEAQAQARLALSRQLATEAERLVDQGRPDVAILVGLQSLSLAHDHSPHPPAAVVTALGWVTHASRLLTGHTDAVWGLAFSPDGALLATASADDTVRLWNPFFHDWVAVGCELVNRNLSMSEWDHLLPGVPYERTCPDLPAGQGAPPDAPAARYAE